MLLLPFETFTIAPISCSPPYVVSDAATFRVGRARWNSWAVNTTPRAGYPGHSSVLSTWDKPSFFLTVIIKTTAFKVLA